MAELTFTVDSALLSELGEKLVESPHIALVELVKNAYDADATSVAVKIIPNIAGGTDVHISDNGSGMTFRDVQRYWMRIATTHKENTYSPEFGRPRTGKKGIGRFACRRLGTHLELNTTARLNGSYERTQVSFPWLEFRAGEELSTIPCEGEVKKVPKTKPGTTLIITGNTSDQWKKRGFDYLKRQLAVLTANRGVRRQGFKEDPGFNVQLLAPGLSEEIVNLRDRLLIAGWGDLNIKVDNDGKVTYELDAMRLGKKSAIHPRAFPNLASVTARIGIMPQRRDEMRKKDVISKKSLKEIVDEWGGVYVRFKGFRVYPFGERSNDWLNIDSDRGTRKTALSALLRPFAINLRGVNPGRALLSLLSSESYIGDVEIGEKAVGFEPKASREGFVGEDAVNDLREVIRFGIDWSTIYREYFRNVMVRGEAEEARTELEVQLRENVEPQKLIDTALRVVRSEVKKVASQLPTAERQQVLRSIKTATSAIEKHEASNLEERRHLQLVASTSTLLLIFSHEVKSLLTWFEEVRTSLDNIRKNVSKPQANQLAKIQSEFGETKDRLIDLLSMTSLISVKRRAEPARLTLLPRLERAIRSFDLIRNSYSVDFDIDNVNPSLQVGPMLEAELFAVLLNLLSNSIKSVISHGGKRNISIAAERRGTKAIINIRDNGIGIDENDFDEVFSPFTTDPKNKLYRGLSSRLNPEDEYIVGTGSGLGLSIVREILMFRGGTIQFVKPQKGWNADIEIVLP